MVEWIAVTAAAVSVVGTIGAAIVSGRANRRTVQTEKTLPPYEELALSVARLEKQGREDREHARALENLAEKRADAVAALERRTECMEGKLDELQAALDEDRDWIKRAIVVAETRDALEHIRPLPAWYDPHSDSARQRRANPDT